MTVITIVPTMIHIQLLVLGANLASALNLLLIEADRTLQAVCQRALQDAASAGLCNESVQLISRDGCSPNEVALGTANALQYVIQQGGVHAVVAPRCSDELSEVARLLWFSKLPVLVRSIGPAQILDPNVYPGIVQFSTLTAQGLVQALALVMAQLNVTLFNLAGPDQSTVDYPISSAIADYLRSKPDAVDIEVNNYVKVNESQLTASTLPAASQLYLDTSVVVFSGDFQDLDLALNALDADGLAYAGYTLIVAFPHLPTNASTLPTLLTSTNFILWQIAPTVNFDQNDDNNKASSVLPALLGANATNGIRVAAQQLYNACYGFCFASKNQFASSAPNYYQAFAGQSFTNPIGQVQFDARAGVLPNYTCQVAKSLGSSFQVPTNVDKEFWSQRVQSVPLACRLAGTCFNYTALVVAAIAGVVLFLGGLFSYFYRRNAHLSAYRLHWRVHKNAFKVIENRMAKGSSGRENQDLLSTKRRVLPAYALLGSVKAEMISMKQLKKIRWIRPQLRYFFELRQLTSDNLATFLGVCCNDLDKFYLFYSIAERASLEDFVLDPEFHMDHTFQSAFTRDIIKGLQFLHKSHIGYHGLLCLANCVIDANWVLKLTNFGVATLLSDMVGLGILAHVEQLNLQFYLSVAPETLENVVVPKQFPRGNPQADIYSLGIVFYAIMYRQQPFDKSNLHRREAIKALAEGKLSPDWTGLNDDAMLKLIKDCCARDPNARPRMRQIHDTIGSYFAQAKGNLVDQMLKMNEKYAQHLEKLVEERNNMLLEAQKQTDRLLFEMLPSSVASTLKAGGKIPPRSYDSATVLFAQLCYFNKIIERSTPEQVINFLNDVFQQFDTIIHRFDAYKVETTGETYMVASGVPNENEGRHVVEIAEIALAIRQCTLNYVVRHMSNEHLAVRVGFHCGPIAAGVIGLRSPRYCLFGDTVNFASRMQSNCPPNQIQTSEPTAHILLEKHGARDYTLIQRGVVKVKGKGDVNCYWLNEHEVGEKGKGQETENFNVADEIVETTETLTTTGERPKKKKTTTKREETTRGKNS